MIDWKRVTDLREEVGEDEFRPLVEMFLDEIEAGLMGLASRDGVGLQEKLHLLQGCALNMGLSAFFRTCDTWEKLLARGAGDRFDADLLMASYATSKQLLLRDLDRLGGAAGKSGVA